jgi:hypothetical protein
MVQPKVRGLEIEAARQANERDRTSADQVNPRKSGTPAPHRDAERQIVSPNPTGGGDHTGSLAKALGVADRDFADGLWGNLLAASARGPDKFDKRELFFTLAVIKGKKSKDELDIMLLAQMSAIHAALMKFSGDLARAETALEVESLTRAVNQLARVYVIQYDAFNRHHNGIAQQVQNASGCQGQASHCRQYGTAAAATVGQTLSKAAPALTDDRRPAT